MAGKLMSEKGKKVRSPKKGRITGTSDDDPGYLWGKAGQAKARRLENKRNSGYKMWENQK